MSRVVHFDIQVNDLPRAQAFYRAALGWRFEDYSDFVGSPYWGVITGEEGQPGINGGMMPRPAAAPSAQQGINAYVCTVQVEDYDATERRILEAGGAVAQPKYALPGMAWQGYYADTEGNTFGVHQADPRAGL